jgi:hypothetical protein
VVPLWSPIWRKKSVLKKFWNIHQTLTHKIYKLFWNVVPLCFSRDINICKATSKTSLKRRKHKFVTKTTHPDKIKFVQNPWLHKHFSSGEYLHKNSFWASRSFTPPCGPNNYRHKVTVSRPVEMCSALSPAAEVWKCTVTWHYYIKARWPTGFCFTTVMSLLDNVIWYHGLMFCGKP